MTKVMEKLTTRNLIAIATVFTFLSIVSYGVVNTAVVMVALENPLVTYILGTFTGVVVLVYNFFFRKTQAKESLIPPEKSPGT